MIYPFNVELTKKYVNELINGKRNVISVHFAEEFDFAEKMLEAAGVPFTSSLDTPEDAVIERLCQHCEGITFRSLDLDSSGGMSAANEGWNCICNNCGKLTK